MALSTVIIITFTLFLSVFFVQSLTRLNRGTFKLAHVTVTSGVITLSLMFIFAVTILSGSLINGSVSETSDFYVLKGNYSEPLLLAKRDDGRGGRDNRRPPRPQPQPDRDGRSVTTTSGDDESLLSDTDFIIEAEGADESDVSSVQFSWEYRTPSLRSQSYSIEIELLDENISEAQSYLNYLERLAYEWSWDIVDELSLNGNESSEEVYIAICQTIYQEDEGRMDEIAEGFQTIFDEQDMDDIEQVYFVTTLIQNIEYMQPGGELDILPPTLTFANQYGDCDTTSMLAYVILEKLGFEVVMMASDVYGHAMLGVNASATGEYLTYEGIKYYFMEMTYPNWNLGEIDASCENTDYWYAFKLD